MNLEWDGRVRQLALSEQEVLIRRSLADAAKMYDWPRVVDVVRRHKELINTTRPDGSSLYAPLHQAAHGGASVEVAVELLRLGAWRTLQNSRGERPVDVAERRGHRHLLDILTPKLKQRIPHGVLFRMRSHFHRVIHERADDEVREFGLRLPEIEPMLEFGKRNFRFDVLGMYGGFSYWLERDGVDAMLITESWVRIIEGSGKRHEISSAGSRLVAEGFV